MSRVCPPCSLQHENVPSKEREERGEFLKIFSLLSFLRCLERGAAPSEELLGCPGPKVDSSTAAGGAPN